MDLVVPDVRIAPAEKVGHFRSAAAFEHFLAAYRASMAGLPPVGEVIDVPTSFGTVRAYRFDGPGDGPPVLLLPGRNASTPVWRGNLPGVLSGRTAYCIDLLGEAGLSVQDRPIAGPDDQAQWLDEALAGLGLDVVHLMGVSIGGWTATNCAVRRPGRVASLTLLDPAMTFARIPVKTAVMSIGLFAPGVPEALRRYVLRWIAGGADADDSVPEAALIAAASSDFVLRSAMPTVFTDDQLRSLDVPVLAFIAAAELIDEMGGLDVLVNNAGVEGRGENNAIIDAGAVTADMVREVFDTNVFGVVRVTHAFLPLLQRSPAPVVVNVSSSLGSLNLAQSPESPTYFYPGVAYPASKSAVNMITVQFAKQFPRLRINAVEPGYTDTDLNGHTGTQTVEEGASIIVEMAQIAPDGPTAGYFSAYGRVSW